MTRYDLTARATTPDTDKLVHGAEICINCVSNCNAPLRVGEVRSQVDLPPSRYIRACTVRIFLNGILEAGIRTYGRQQESPTDIPVLAVRPVLFTGRKKSKSYYDRQSVGQSVLVSGTHLGPATNFSPSLLDYF
jgi:hypothetical protein